MSPDNPERTYNDLDSADERPDGLDTAGPSSASGAGRPELGRVRSGREGSAYAETRRRGGGGGGGGDDGLPPLVVGEGRTSGGRGPNRLIPLLIGLLLIGAAAGGAIWTWNKRHVERRAAAILADLENAGGEDEARGGAGSGDRNPGAPDLRWPIIAEISSPYGYRVHPISKERKLHNGIDIAAPYWKEVFAAGDGTIEWAARKGGKGNTVIIRHNKSFQTVYCHLQKCKVKKGEKVIKGDLIGWVGSTGYSRGPHLHLELHKNGTPVDPAPYLPEPTEAMLKRMKEKGIETLSD